MRLRAAYTLWYAYTPPTDGFITISTSSPTTFAAPFVAIFQGSPHSSRKSVSRRPRRGECSDDVLPPVVGARLLQGHVHVGRLRGDTTAPPANDLIENATPIDSLPFTATQDSTDATVSPTDPPPACGHGASTYSLWYSYTASTDGFIKSATSSPTTFATPNSTIYQGPPDSLTQVGCGGQIVPVTAGTTYYLRLSVPGCCYGTFTLNVSTATPPANDLIENATPITSLPFTATQDSTDATVSPTIHRPPAARRQLHPVVCLHRAD